MAAWGRMAIICWSPSRRIAAWSTHNALSERLHGL